MDEFRKVVLLNTPRILGFIDRKSDSATYGCCERYFWHYKLHDFLNARFQEACLLLSLLYQNGFPGNQYCEQRSILDCILGIVDFWLQKRNNDGSCAELYPYERCFCATSFSAFAISESLLILLEGSAKSTVSNWMNKSDCLSKLQKTGKWLLKNMSYEVTNQVAAALNALTNIFLLTGNISFDEASKEIIFQLREKYEKYGYFPEYGGFDLGYTTITTSCLAYYSEKIDCPDAVLTMLKSINQSLGGLIDRNGNYDYSKMSRNTTFAYPFGFYRTSSPVIGKIESGLADNQVLSPLWMDDRYCIALTIDYLKTFVSFQNK